jgi:hypothetical protein
MYSKLPPNPTNTYEEQQWRNAVSAANTSMGSTLDPRFTNMAMHQQQKDGEPVISPWADKVLLDSHGPFINTVPAKAEEIAAGKAIAQGPRAYIDFYGKKRR